jgi:hypothetical protein
MWLALCLSKKYRFLGTTCRLYMDGFGLRISASTITFFMLNVVLVML